MKETFLIAILCMTQQLLFAQFVISDGTLFSAAANTEIRVITTGDVINGTTFDFQTTAIQLTLLGVDQNIQGNLGLRTLDIEGGGTKTITGQLTVRDNINFTSGKLKASDLGKILFTGTANLEGNDGSYIEGILYRTNGTPRIYPVGTASVFAPMSFNSNVGNDREIAVQFIPVDPGISISDDPDVASILTEGYWEIITTDLEPLNSKVSLSLTPFLLSIPADQEAIVLQRDGSTSSNLGNAASAQANFVSSDKNVTGSVVGVGTTTDVEVTIIDLISPYDENAINDKLHIINIQSQKFTDQRVTLLDRYGVFVESWEGEDVKEYIDFDFRKLSPGNYICVVEYNNGGKSERKLQMITILKSK